MKRLFLTIEGLGVALLGEMRGVMGLFLAGITLLQKAKKKRNKEILAQAFLEFEKVAGGEAGPLAYVGMALVYEYQKKHQEEAAIFEQAFQRYHQHPLLKQLELALMNRLPACGKWPREFAFPFF